MSKTTPPEEQPRKPADSAREDERRPSDAPVPGSHPEEQPARDDSTHGARFPDLESLRLSQDFVAQTSVRPVFTSIPVRKPHRQEFVRVRPGQEWRFETGLFKDEESGEFYIVSPSLWADFSGDIKPTCLVTCVSRNSPVPFLWPITLPGPDGRPNRWHESAADSAREAERDWLKVVADMSAGCYVPHVAAGNLPEPVWPADLVMADLMKLAFRDRFIGDADHPTLRRLRGEA